MKTLRKYNIKGFSLIELMVVVAIIGVLSAIAIPNFQRFQRKARQSEAKSALGGLYTAQKAFLSEWEMYHSNFESVGFNLDGDLAYNTGFTGADDPCALVADTAPTCAAFVGRYTGVASTLDYFDTAALCAASADCVDNSGRAVQNSAQPAQGPDTFTAGSSASDIGSGNPDDWTINQAKVLSNVLSGL